MKKLDIIVGAKELRNIDIETQVSYDSGTSRIDLQILLQNRFLIFLESKIVSTKIDNIYNQLKKYRKILESKRLEFEKIRLIYIGKYPPTEKESEKLRRKLKLKNREFLFFSWQDLLKLTSHLSRQWLGKLFNNYIGDSMFNKKQIKEQKLKNVVDVLVIFTNPAFWEMTSYKKIAVQKNAAPDAHYIAFLRTHLRPKSAITHIAEVESTEINVPRKNMLIGLPPKVMKALLEFMKKRNANLEDGHKEYKLKAGSLVPLAHPIVSQGQGAQVNFRTTMAELLKAHTTKDIRKGSF
ncbi:PD-(D/E)XK nuclease family protein [Patescibacteria group bacterium]|nr:PD-(D/E)XK nuclease family protein [Patescibacteria group bacterium]